MNPSLVPKLLTVLLILSSGFLNPFRIDAVNLRAADAPVGVAASLEEAERRLAQAREIWHVGPVVAASLSHDGRFAVTGGADRILRLTETSSNKIVHRLEGHTGTIHAVALSANGKRAASASSDRTVRVWDLETGKAVQVMAKLKEPARCVACSAEGDLVAAGGQDEQIRLWEAATGKQLYALPQKAAIQCLAFSPDGKLLVSGGSDGSLCLWDVASGQLRHRKTSHADGVLVVAFDAAGERLLSAGGAVKFDSNRGGFHPGDNTIRVWEATTGELRSTIPVNDVLPIAAVFTQGGQQIDLTGFLLTTERREQIPLFLKVFLFTTMPPVGMYFMMDHRVYEHVSRHPVIVTCDVDLGKVHLKPSLSLPERAGLPIAISADGRSVLSGWLFDNRLAVSNPAGRPPFHWIGPKSPAVLERGSAHYESPLFSLAISKDGRRVLGGGSDRALHLWDGDSGVAMLKLGTHKNPVSAVALSADGRRALSACGWVNDLTNPMFAYSMKIRSATIQPPADLIPDYQLYFWDVEQRQQLAALAGHNGRINALSFSPDGRKAASVSSDQTVGFWDLERKKLLYQSRGHKGVVTCLAFSPNGHRLVTGGYDRIVRIWDTNTGHELRRFSGHNEPIWKVAWSPGGSIIASAGYDTESRNAASRIILWSTVTSKKLREFSSQNQPVIHLEFTADSAQLLAMTLNEIKVWDGATGKEIKSLPLPNQDSLTAAIATDAGRAVLSEWKSSTCWDFNIGIHLNRLRKP